MITWNIFSWIPTNYRIVYGQGETSYNLFEYLFSLTCQDKLLRLFSFLFPISSEKQGSWSYHCARIWIASEMNVVMHSSYGIILCFIAFYQERARAALHNILFSALMNENCILETLTNNEWKWSILSLIATPRTLIAQKMKWTINSTYRCLENK